MAKLRLFASIREAAGTGATTVDGDTVGAALDAAIAKFGGPESPFATVLGECNVWCNGVPAELGDAVSEADEIALLPPVSGG